MRIRGCVALACCVACAPSPAPSRVEILPLPEVAPSVELDAAVDDDDPACEPQPLRVIDPDASGGLNAPVLRERLLESKAFAERCCTGDESGDLVVEVTLQPDGYDTRVVLEAELSATGPTRACVVGVFRRVIVKAYRGSAVTLKVPLHLK